MVTAQLNRKFVLDQMQEAIAVISQVADGEDAEEPHSHTGQLAHDISTFTVRGGASRSHESHGVVDNPGSAIEHSTFTAYSQAMYGGDNECSRYSNQLRVH